MPISRSYFAVVLMLVAGVTLHSQMTAQAATGCSTTKSVPGINIKYSFCDSQFASKTTWTDFMYVNTGVGSSWVYTQVNIRIDGTDHILAPKDHQFFYGVTYWDPYNDAAENQVTNKCTNGHTYFPIVRISLHNGTWGPWAQAGQFVC